MNLPNKITILRIIMMPVFVACFYLPVPYAKEIAALIYLIANITDIIDGRLARIRNIVTSFGKLMDPIADKLLALSAFIMLTHFGLISPVAAIIVMARELLISGFRLVAVESGTVIAASNLGKLKTISQCVAVIAVLIWERIAFIPVAVDQVLLWIAVAITIWSGADYIIKYTQQVHIEG